MKPIKTKQPSVKEQKYYGIHACLAIFEYRPSDIIKLYIHESNVKQFSLVLKWCAKNKKAYHIVTNQDLEKITESVHHEGVCLVAKQITPLSFEECKMQLTSPHICLLYLDGVQNPHNIGSILRTAAHFGIAYILGNKLPHLSSAACRIAKGGAEIVKLVQLDHPKQAIVELKKLGFAFASTSSHGGHDLYAKQLPERTIFAMGAEDQGISQEMEKLATFMIQIPGTGLVESLNVSVATSLLLGEYARQHPTSFAKIK